ncbi:hypothetical protein [Ensifer sp.]|jgi:hypothetical protein|uniref:hypothetical protein n=1 Tax=Ensifer sp. TaxID=1872086 RepID=UPI002E109009|nr:hypothetical protein [Ensifer sp.]
MRDPPQDAAIYHALPSVPVRAVLDFQAGKRQRDEPLALPKIRVTITTSTDQGR